MKIKKLDLLNFKETQFIEELYMESFPHSERRPVEEMFNLYKANPSFAIAIVLDDDLIIGFLTYWDLDTFIFAEHFAVSSNHRNKGYGGKAMDLLIGSITKPIVLEVELPTTILSERRIGFYQRIGFKLWENVQYLQPSYHNDGNAIPMKLMSFGNIDVKQNLTEIRSNIYTTVYNC